MDKNYIVAQAHHLVYTHWDAPRPENGDDFGGCIFFATALKILLRDRFQIQAGTMKWPANQEENFEFVWEPRSIDTILSLREAELPEMHIWGFIPDRNELVDLTTGTFPFLAKHARVGWTKEKPAPYLWCRLNEVPDGVSYIPFPSAIQVAEHFIKHLLKFAR